MIERVRRRHLAVLLVASLTGWLSLLSRVWTTDAVPGRCLDASASAWCGMLWSFGAVGDSLTVAAAVVLLAAAVAVDARLRARRDRRAADE